MRSLHQHQPPGLCNGDCLFAGVSELSCYR